LWIGFLKISICLDRAAGPVALEHERTSEQNKIKEWNVDHIQKFKRSKKFQPPTK
jgi:hypothetical protein